MKGMREALRILHEDFGVRDVVITSIPLIKGEGLERDLPEGVRRSSIGDEAFVSVSTSTNEETTRETKEEGEYLLCVSSSKTPDGKILTHAMRVRKISGYFSGVGDLFSALVCGHYHPRSAVSSNPSLSNIRPMRMGTGLGMFNPGSGGMQSSTMKYSKPSPPQTPVSHATYMALVKTVYVLRSTQAYYVGSYSRLGHSRSTFQSPPISSMTSESSSQTEANTNTEMEPELNMTDTEKDASDPLRVVRRMRGRELRLIQCQDVLRRKVLGEFGVRKMGDDGMIYWEGFWE